jgi:hypothetical protein
VFSTNVHLSAEARIDYAPLQRWEDEGGHHTDDGSRVETGRGRHAPAGLSWSEFLTRSFPGRRRHDLVALEAYEAYRSESESRRGATS